MMYSKKWNILKNIQQLKGYIQNVITIQLSRPIFSFQQNHPEAKIKNQFIFKYNFEKQIWGEKVGLEKYCFLGKAFSAAEK